MRQRDAGVDLPPDLPAARAPGVSNAFLAGDLFNLFVGFEILLFASYVLLTIGGTGDADPGRRRSTWWSTCSARCCS